MLRPEPGHWRLKWRPGAPWVPARIFWVETVTDPDFPENDMRGTRSRYLAAEINGRPVSIDEVWLRKRQFISAQEYAYMIRVRDWAETHAPEVPEANPYEAVDLNRLPPSF